MGKVSLGFEVVAYNKGSGQQEVIVNKTRSAKSAKVCTITARFRRNERINEPFAEVMVFAVKECRLLNSARHATVPGGISSPTAASAYQSRILPIDNLQIAEYLDIKDIHMCVAIIGFLISNVMVSMSKFSRYQLPPHKYLISRAV
jgi:hypothetical protein